MNQVVTGLKMNTRTWLTYLYQNVFQMFNYVNITSMLDIGDLQNKLVCENLNKRFNNSFTNR